MLYEYIIENYAIGEPIFISDIQITGLSEVNLRQQFKVLTDTGKIVRYSQGIYYIPKKSKLKGTNHPGADTIAYYKYISRGNHINGYYSGYTFANQLGILTQVPSKVEIVSNLMSAKKRDVVIGSRSFIVRKPSTPINEENYRILQLLDLLKNLDKYADEDNVLVKEKLAAFVQNNKITRNALDEYISNFPDSTYRHLYEMRLDYVLA